MAHKAFQQIMDITNNKFSPREIYFTNLCNDALPHAPANQTVLLPESRVDEGVERIRQY